MQSWRTEAIILRRTNYGEADRILNVLTPEHGKVSAIAKGVRRPKSKLAGGLELFAVCDLTIMQGRSDMGVITSARLQQFFGDILHDYDRLQAGYEAVKEVNRATETVSEPDFYYLLRDTLQYLNQLPIDWRLSELWFRLKLSHLLGYALNVSTTHGNQPLRSDATYSFDTAEMLFVPASHGRYSGDVLKVLRLTSVHTPDTLRHINGLDEPLAAALDLVRLLKI